MNKKVILEEIRSIELKLLGISTKVYEAKNYSSVEHWIKYILEKDKDLARYFLIPIEEPVVGSIITLITINSSMAQPMINLLSNRIGTLNSAIPDIRQHPVSGKIISTVLENFGPLLKLLKKYNAYHEQSKNIDLVCKALKENRLHLYKRSSNDPDVRVILKTLQLDKSRDNKEDLNYLLNFLFTQLQRNHKQAGFINPPHYAWWSLLDVVTESEDEWLQANTEALNNILAHFLDANEYIPSVIDFTSIIPEINSVYYQKIWITIDMIRIVMSDKSRIFAKEILDKLKRKINSNLQVIIGDENDESVRSYQCKLLLLYESVLYFNYLETISLSESTTLTIKNSYIGKYLYADEVKSKFNEIRESIVSFIANRNSWQKHTLTSLLISGSPGQGKSEIADQIKEEIEQISKEKDKKFRFHGYAIGKNISDGNDLSNILNNRILSSEDGETIQVILFDEFDKAANFDFFAPFLSVLESPINSKVPLTFWIFAQSSYPTLALLEMYANTIENKSLRDFLTRMRLGAIDIPELRVSPQQRVFTALGYALSQNPELEKVSRDFVRYIGGNLSYNNNRDLIQDFTKKSVIKSDSLNLKLEESPEHTQWIALK